MLYLLLVYLVFVLIYAVFGTIGIHYVRVSGRGSGISRRVIRWFKVLSVVIIILTLVSLLFEAAL